MSVSQTVSLQAGSAWLAMQSAKAQLDSAIAGLAAAKQSYDLEVMRDSAGKSIEVERLDSLTALVRAKADMVSAQTMMVKSRADLNAAIGTR
jgi:outer membrane protein TolC